jgi:hypothetical protein
MALSLDQYFGVKVENEWIGPILPNGERECLLKGIKSLSRYNGRRMTGGMFKFPRIIPF